MTTREAVKHALAAGELQTYGSLTALAKRLNVTRARVHQLFVEESWEDSIHELARRAWRRCKVCGKPLSDPHRTHRTPHLRIDAQIHRRCYNPQTSQVAFTCGYCGRPGTKPRSQLGLSKHGLFFCDRHCRSKMRWKALRGKAVATL